jgi:AcrR family transcriptional regulator
MKRRRQLKIVDENNRIGQICTTAAEIICAKGYDATSLNDIADAVGLTKPGLYHYISGKESLLFAIMTYGMQRLEEEVIEPARQIADPEQRLRTILITHARLITERGKALTILVDEVAALTPAHRRAITRRKRAYYEFLRDTLKELQAQGKLRDVDVTVAAFSLFGMLLTLSRWYRPGGRLTSEQVAEEVAKVAFYGILAAEKLGSA